MTTMNESDKKSDIVDDKLPITWAVVVDPELEGYKVFYERITPVNSKNHERIGALQDLLTVITKDHSDEGNSME